MDCEAVLRRLHAVGYYRGLPAIELDYLHPDYPGDEDDAVAQSVAEPRRLVFCLGAP
ncbi:MAG: hypothetical protein GX605_07430 [Chloroflexi bacterium]|nr:hypothetical protein [Chloroflexota bacterium]